MLLTHILVDFDNRQPTIEELSQLSAESLKPGYVQALLAHQGRAQLVHCTKAGHNAVDMHIALHIGRLIADNATPDASPSGDVFVVVSGDGDFAPVLEFVGELGYSARQVKSLNAALGEALAKKAPVKLSPPM